MTNPKTSEAAKVIVTKSRHMKVEPPKKAIRSMLLRALRYSSAPAGTYLFAITERWIPMPGTKVSIQFSDTESRTSLRIKCREGGGGAFEGTLGGPTGWRSGGHRARFKNALEKLNAREWSEERAEDDQNTSPQTPSGASPRKLATATLLSYVRGDTPPVAVQASPATEPTSTAPRSQDFGCAAHAIILRKRFEAHVAKLKAKPVSKNPILRGLDELLVRRELRICDKQISELKALTDTFAAKCSRAEQLELFKLG